MASPYPGDMMSKAGTEVKDFSGFGLGQSILQRIKEEIKISRPTKVQAACIPEILKGRNCIAQAPTGSGKTMAFAIPMIQKWSQDPHSAYGLVLTPTRELAHQIKDQFKFLCGNFCKVIVITGGTDYQKQATELMSLPHFIIATPGRFVDMLENAEGEGNFKRIFRNVRFLVLDEADRLLHPQFKDQLQVIKGCMPKAKQTLFFSATITDHEAMKEQLVQFSEIDNEPFVYNYQQGDPSGCSETGPLLAQQNLVHKFISCPRDFKDGYLMELLRQIRDDNSPPDIRSMIIFATTRRECQVLSVLLTALEFSNVSLHADMDQVSRLKALSDFKSSQITTLIATDVASRGLDIKTVDLVINYSVPMPEDYVHRVGRTGRDSRPGLAVMFLVIPRDIQYLKNLESYIREDLTEMKFDEGKVLDILAEVQAQRRLADASVLAPDLFAERAILKRELQQAAKKNKKKKKQKLN